MTDLERAAAHLQAGFLVAFPTETVYGLGADASNPEAVTRIFKAKGRPADHPLIVHLQDDSLLSAWAKDIPDTAFALSEAFWPGPLTLILKKHDDALSLVTGGQNTIGIRVPSHPMAQALLQAFLKKGGGQTGKAGIAAPSANRFGKISPTQAEHVRHELGDAPLILDGGASEVGIESTILDLSGNTPRILRPGRILASQIEKVIGVLPSLAFVGQATEIRAPGLLPAHYAPQTPLEILKKAALKKRLEEDVHKKYAYLTWSFYAHNQTALQLSGDPERYAHELYAALRQLDQSGKQAILVEALPKTEDWQAIEDRLHRAEHGSRANAS